MNREEIEEMDMVTREDYIEEAYRVMLDVETIADYIEDVDFLKTVLTDKQIEISELQEQIKKIREEDDVIIARMQAEFIHTDNSEVIAKMQAEIRHLELLVKTQKSIIDYNENKLSELTEQLDAAHIFCEGVKEHYIKKACEEFCSHCLKHSMCLTLKGYPTEKCATYQSFKNSIEEHETT